MDGQQIRSSTQKFQREVVVELTLNSNEGLASKGNKLRQHLEMRNSSCRWSGDQQQRKMGPQGKYATSTLGSAGEQLEPNRGSTAMKDCSARIIIAGNTGGKKQVSSNRDPTAKIFCTLTNWTKIEAVGWSVVKGEWGGLNGAIDGIRDWELWSRIIERRVHRLVSSRRTFIPPKPSAPKYMWTGGRQTQLNWYLCVTFAQWATRCFDVFA